MAAGKSAGGTDAVIPDLMPAEPLMHPGEQVEVGSTEAACQQQGRRCQQDHKRFSF
jgi:hypothetical protein